jgi:hypothetical protein
VISTKLKRNPLLAKVVMAVALIAIGSVAAFGWFTDLKIHTLQEKIAEIRIAIENENDDAWLYTLENEEINASGSFTLVNNSDRETYMRVGVISTWLDAAEKPIMAEADASHIIKELQIVSAVPDLQLDLDNAEISINGASYDKKTFIKLVEADQTTYAKIPPASASEESLRLTCSFNVAATGVPDGAHYLRLSFVPEAIQATDSALAYVQDKESGLNAPW